MLEALRASPGLQQMQQLTPLTVLLIPAVTAVRHWLCLAVGGLLECAVGGTGEERSAWGFTPRPPRRRISS